MSNDKGLSIRKNMAWNSLGSLVYLGCNWLTTVLVVTIYPTYDAAGYLAAAMAVGNVVAAIVLFKVRAFQVSDIKKQFDSSDYIILRMICAFIGIAFGLLYSLFSVSDGAFGAAIAYSVFKAIESFIDVLHGIDQCHNRLDISGISQITRGILVLAAFSSTSLLTNDLLLAINAMTLVTFLVLVVYDIPSTRKLEDNHLSLNINALPRLAAACMPGFISSVFATLVVSLSRQLYGLEFGDGQLGIYAAIATPAVIVQAMASYLYAPLLGPIAIAFLNNDYSKVKRGLVKFFIALTTLTALTALAFLFLAEPLFHIAFGPDIAKYSYLIQPVLLSTSLTAAEFFIIDILIVFRKKLAAILTCIPAVLAAPMLIAPLSYVFGMNGISYTICLCYFLSILMSIPVLHYATNKAL